MRHIDYAYMRLTAVAILAATATTARANEGDMVNIFNVPHMMAYLVAALLIAIFVMIFSNRLYYYREREVSSRAEQMNAQLELILRSNKTSVWTYDCQKGLFSLLMQQKDARKDFMPIDFSQFFDRDDFQQLRSIIAAVRDRHTLSDSLQVKGVPFGESGQPQRTYSVSVSILRRDRRNRPTLLLGTQRDITEERERAQKARNLTLRYHTVFNSSLIDMVFYNADGIMIDINDKACESFDVADRQALLAARPSIADVPALEGVDVKNLTESMYTTSITNLADITNPIGGTEEAYWGNKIYYEQIMTPIRDQEGQLTGIVMAGRNTTDMVNSHHHQQLASMKLEKNTKDIQAYIENINFALKTSEVRLMNYYPDTHELEISSDLSNTQYRLSQLKAISLVRECDRRKAKGLFSRMDRRRTGAIEGTVRTMMRDSKQRDVFLHFNVMPITAADGRITHYFGMCRNETEMTYTEMQLRQETEKAQETEQLKNTFLLNMSHELRTPLSAVIGFAELFNGEHSPEDEPVFAEEIRKNTGVLLQLINDILFLSRLDARMIEFNYQDYDFATLFDGWCYMGWSALGPGVKTAVENPYSRLIVSIDQQNLGMVIQKLCLFSGNTVREGMVRAKYEYRRGELMITIEDNGEGFSKEAQQKVFERFSREDSGGQSTTGLDLPIVKELVEQMGGNIELQSEPGKGSTFFVSIPCQMADFEKKAEIMI